MRPPAVPGVLGIGVDAVDLEAFAEQLAEPGTRFADVFTPTERRQAADRAAGPGGDGVVTPPSRHLGARWAAKEAVVKAWSAAYYGTPPPIAPEHLEWTEIEVVSDAFGRPAIRLRGAVAAAVRERFGDTACWHLSMTHEGDLAVAFVALTA